MATSKQQPLKVHMDAMLAMSAYCQRQWVRQIVRLHMTRGNDLKMTLLSGDAGCGKSFALAMLVKTLKTMNVSVLVSATTNKAAAALIESSSLDAVCTLHKAMGFKKDLLDDTMSHDEFCSRYRRVHCNAIARYNALRANADLCHRGRLDTVHACAHLSAESCAVCSKVFQRLHACADWPPFVGANVLVVDEYGLLNMTLMDRVLACMRMFYGESKGPLIVFAGSVSQLQPMGRNERLWETPRFESMLDSATPLLVNRRQFGDPGYAEAITYLQYNTVTVDARRVFESRVTVQEQQVLDPAFEPNKLRIFHQDKLQRDYTVAYLKRIGESAVTGDKCIDVVRNRWANNGIAGFHDVLKQAAQAFPKLFTVPPYVKGVKTTPRDYLAINKLWVGCNVRLIWTMTQNSIRPAKPTSARRAAESPPVKNARVESCDVDGTIQSIQRKDGHYEFLVRGSQSGTLYQVGPAKWTCENWTVTTHPLACLLAMNTYDCQGSTVHGYILYHPPRHFHLSPIKPSVYVALSRVTRRDKLELTNSNFADNVGYVPIYDDRLVAYRKRVELCYA